MKLQKPTTSKQMPDGIYLGKLESVKEAISKQNGAKQLEFQFMLNTKDRTLIWVNQSAKGFDMIIRAGLATELPDGQVEIAESGVVCGVTVQNGRGVVVPATVAAKMNPTLSKMLVEVAKVYQVK